MNELINKSLELGDIHMLLGFPTPLMSKTETRIVEWVTDYTTRFGTPPTVDRLTTEFDTFLPVKSADPLGDIYERELIKKRNNFTRQYILGIQDKLKSGADPLPYMQELLTQIGGGRADVTRYSSFDRSSYLRHPKTVPYGIEQLDAKTGGIAQGDLIYCIGRLGTGKTTLSLWVLTKMLLQGKRILMASNENRADDVVAKIDSYLGGFNPLNKRTMRWTEDDKNRISTVSYMAKHMEGEVFISNRPVQDVKEVRSLIYSYRPDIVMIDGIYLMKGVAGDSHWEKITNISRELKQIAMGEGCPVWGIHQASRNAIGKRIEVEHVAYADALAQDCDTLWALNPEEDGSIFVEAIKSRFGDGKWGFFVKFFFDTMTCKILDAKTALEGD